MVVALSSGDAFRSLTSAAPSSSVSLRAPRGKLRLSMSASQAASQARADFTKTKIIATLGPSSATIEEIEALLLLGANVFRLNFSHGEKEEHAARMAAIRSLEVKHGVAIGVLLDLQGPKLRVGKFGGDGEVMLAQGDAFRLDLEDKPGDATRVQLPHPEILSAVTPGMNLLVNDGKVRSFEAPSAVDIDRAPLRIARRSSRVDSGPVARHGWRSVLRRHDRRRRRQGFKPQGRERA